MILVDREIDPPGTDGLNLAQALVKVAPRTPVIVLSHRADKRADEEAADTGVADFLLVPGLSADRLEHAIRYAITHQTTLQRLAESEERHALALRGANDGIWDWDVTRDTVFYSSRWKTMLGYREHEVGDDPRRVAGPRAQRRPRRAHARARRVRPAEPVTEHFEFEHRLQHRDGSYRWMLARATAVRDADGKAHRVVGSITDVTDRREAERRLQHDALHDALTGLPNRVLFVDRVDRSIRRALRQHPECCAAVLFLDLDRFKVINDSLGHAAGDQLLKAVAQRLEAALRPNDTVARLSGDEFTLLLDDVCEAREATIIAERVLQSLQDAVPARRARAVHRRVDRDRAGDGAQRPRAGDARRRRRDVPRQGQRQGPPRGLRRRDARAGHAPAQPGARPSQRRSSNGALDGRLPADRADRHGPHRGLRGAAGAGRTASRPTSWPWPRRRASPSRSGARC